MEYLTAKQAKEIFGISERAFIRYINEGRFKDVKHYRSTLYVEKRELAGMVEIHSPQKRGYISKTDIKKALHISDNEVEKFIEREKLDITYIEGYKYILKADFEKAASKYLNKNTDGQERRLDNDAAMVDTNYFKERYQLEEGTILDWYKSGYIKGSIISNGQLRINRGEIVTVINLIIKSKEIQYVNVDVAERMTGFKEKWINKMCRNGDIRDFKQAQNNHTRLIAKTDLYKIAQKVNDIKENCYTYLEARNKLGISYNAFVSLEKRGLLKRFSYMNNYYVRKEVIEDYQRKLELEASQFYTSDEAADIMDIHVDFMRDILKDKKSFPNSIFENGMWKVSKTDIHNNYLKYMTDEYCSIEEAAERLDMNLPSFRSNYIARDNEFPNTGRLPNGKYRIYIKDIEKLANKRSLKKERIEINGFIDNTDKAYDYFIGYYVKRNKIKKGIGRTVKLYMQFAKDEIIKSRRRNLRVTADLLGRAYLSLATFLKEEILSKTFNDAKVSELLENKSISFSDGNHIANFLKYCRSKYPEECNFKCRLTKKHIQIPGTEKPMLSYESFMKCFIYISDLQKHKEQAILDSRYVQTWIYVMIHFFEAWRASDIVDLPSIRLEGIKASDFKWFETHELTKTQAQMIINQYYLNTFIISKTGALNGFNINDMLLIPFATALVIAEMHRRNNGEEKLLYHFNVNLPRDRDYRRLFCGDKELVKFSNLKACRALITYFYEHMTKVGADPVIASQMVRRLRKHKNINTDSIYIHDVETGERYKSASYLAFDTDTFGWMYHVVLKAIDINRNFKQLAIEEKTKLVMGMQESQSPMQLEGFAKFLIAQQNRKITLVQEILSMPEGRLIEKLKKIYEQVMPANVPEAQCFKYGECPYPNSKEHCFRCEYLLPNRYFLISLNELIYSLIDRINSLSENQIPEYKKIRTKLFECMSLLAEAMNEEIGLGQELVDAFIDREDLSKRLVTMKKVCC